VAVRSLKSGSGEFLQDAPLTDDQISRLKAGLFTVSHAYVAFRVTYSKVKITDNRQFSEFYQ